MRFEFGEKVWDTDKPVYVAGYVIDRKSGSWFYERRAKQTNCGSAREYGLKCRKALISSISIGYDSEGKSFCSDFTWEVAATKLTNGIRGRASDSVVAETLPAIKAALTADVPYRKPT